MYSYLGLGATLIGFGVTMYIYHKKRLKKPLMCPRRAPCETVINSVYSKTLGVPNEILGMAYYALLLGIYSLLLSNLESSAMVVWVLTVLTVSGALFSIYLIVLQAFVLRAWCSWCLVSGFVHIVLVAIVWTLPRGGEFVLRSCVPIFFVAVSVIGITLLNKIRI